jgi:hypothetical protein
VISAIGLGTTAAAEVFNRLSVEPAYADLPAILLGGPGHEDIKDHVRTDRLRKVVVLPVRSKQLAKLLETLIQRKS